MNHTLQRAYAVIGDKTPMLSDCGALCGAACCQADDDGQGGVYLFPGESGSLAGQAWARVSDAGDRRSPPQVSDDPSPWSGFAPILLCDGVCDRAARPLGCRIFPLTPVRGKNGQWTVRMDVRARTMCPLAAHGLRGLDPDFVRAVRDALRIIAEDPEGDAFLEKWQALEEAYRRPLWQ